MEIAEEKGFDLILANDPDADRLAVAERSRKTGEWICFTGDQIGTLLGKWMWDNYGKFSKKVGFYMSAPFPNDDNVTFICRWYR